MFNKTVFVENCRTRANSWPTIGSMIGTNCMIIGNPIKSVKQYLLNNNRISLNTVLKLFIMDNYVLTFSKGMVVVIFRLKNPKDVILNFLPPLHKTNIFTDFTVYTEHMPINIVPVINIMIIKIL